jgi:ribonucleoside-diphosphate reductase alpha chain
MSQMTPYQNFIAVSRYARWLDDENRRETWAETAGRYVSFMRNYLADNYGYDKKDPIFGEVQSAITNLDIVPSMRAIMTAGEALQRNPLAGYNCSFVTVNDPRVFDEAMYVLMNGTGLGFSVEQRYTDQLPVVPDVIEQSDEIIFVEDSKEGWAKAYRELVSELYNGRVMRWDVSSVRPAGARLLTFGGRASGPAPLVDLFNFTISTFRNAQGRRLHPIECHDIMCKVGDIVVVGGVRRSALISLSDLDDFAMAKAKSGNWWENNGQRALANNSVTYYDRPSSTQFLREWRNLIESQSGERGIFNLNGIRKHSEKMTPDRDAARIVGTNPCAEISLRDMGLCNLSEVIIRDTDSVDDVKNKVRLATILGTWQSTLTDFPYLRAGWKANAEDERLLGVSLTGVYGHKKFNDPNDEGLPKRLQALRKVAHETNVAESARVGISTSKAITTLKPSGTVSQLALVSSGIHPWHSEYYIRTVRAANTDPLTRLMQDAGVPNEPDVMKPDKSTVFSFPTKAPVGAVTRHQVTALDHLRLYSIYRNNYTDHNVSITVSVKESEWVAVGAWVYENWDAVGGVSFLPYSEHTYQQAPYQDITREEYEAAIVAFPTDVRFADLHFYETEDGTTGNQTLACTASGCEVVDLS